MRKLITVLGFLVLLVNISFAGMLIVDLYSEEGFGVDSRTNQPTKKPLEAAVNNEGYNLDGSEYVTYSWQIGDWQSGGTCGTVTDTRTVMCMGSDGNTYADSNCSGTKPTTTQTRDTGVSCVTYTWNTTNWTPAVDGNSCGVITQTRTVTCLGSDGNTYPDSSCDGVKPTTTQNVDAGECNTSGSFVVLATLSPLTNIPRETIQVRYYNRDLVLTKSFNFSSTTVSSPQSTYYWKHEYSYSNIKYIVLVEKYSTAVSRYNTTSTVRIESIKLANNRIDQPFSGDSIPISFSIYKGNNIYGPDNFKTVLCYKVSDSHLEGQNHITVEGTVSESDILQCMTSIQ
jgi:hypothetical protein